MRNIIVSIICVLLFSTPALADSNHYRYGGSDTYNQNPSATATANPTATATGGAATIQSGAVQNKNESNIGNGFNNFSPSASAKIERGAVENKNTNIGVNEQDQKQAQGQIQGQLQGQLQGQMIKDSANTSNSNNAAQSTSIVFEAKRELLPIAGYSDGPNMTEYRGPYDKGNAGKVKPWDIKKSWTEEEVDGMYSSFDGAECKLYPIKKLEGSTANLNVQASKTDFVAIIDCKGNSDFAIWGTAAKKALSYGASFIEEKAYSVTFSNKASGWNIGLGGGVSMIGQGSNDNKGGSVGGGTGFGSVETKPVENINVVFFLR